MKGPVGPQVPQAVGRGAAGMDAGDALRRQGEHGFLQGPDRPGRVPPHGPDHRPGGALEERPGETTPPVSDDAGAGEALRREPGLLEGPAVDHVHVGADADEEDRVGKAQVVQFLQRGQGRVGPA